MIEFHGTYFDGRRSTPYHALFTGDERYLRIQVKDKGIDRRIPLRSCKIDPPLGKTSRAIRLPDGAVCETRDTDALTALDVLGGKNRGMRLVNFIESRWKMVVFSLAGLILFVWLFKVYAIPYLAKEIAYAAPPAVAEQLSLHTMKILDHNVLKSSALGTKRISELRALFTELTQDLDDNDFEYRLVFRKSPLFGPNAFALPSGQVVMTDELVRLSENERELEGILLHEIGHVRERHGLRMVIQDAGVFLIVAALLGDLTEISSTAASLPTILARSDYSRDFERAADQFAARYFVRKGWSIQPLQDILERMTKDMPNFPGESVLSTHPVTAERIEYLETVAGEQELK
jgi:Zn-dependent protease with chaperone function